jgi:hypothetical protein
LLLLARLFFVGIEKRTKEKKLFLFFRGPPGRPATVAAYKRDPLSPPLSLSRARELLEVPRKLKKRMNVESFGKSGKETKESKK